MKAGNTYLYILRAAATCALYSAFNCASATADPTTRGVQIEALSSDSNALPTDSSSSVLPLAATDVPQLQSVNLATAKASSSTSATAVPAPSELTEPPSTKPERECIALPGRSPDLSTGIDQNVFDKNLASAFNAHPDEVLIQLGTPTEAGIIPDDVKPWLAELEASGGGVDVSPIRCVRTRGVLSWMRRKIRLMLGLEKTDIYAPVRGYNATLYYDEKSEKTRQILFARRSP